MGFFAVLRDPDNDTPFTVVECHINLWVLNGLFGRSTLTWDIGLRIRTEEAALRKFQIALPSGTDKEGFEDLSDRLLNDQVAQLIFGRPVTFPEHRTINYGKGPLPLSGVPSANVVIDEQRSSSDFTLWKIQPGTPIPSHTEAYLRVRFRATKVGRIWQWKRFLLTRYAALADLRFSDVREAWNVRDGNLLRGYITPIQNLNFFVVVSSRFHLVATSPPLHYTRILEGRPWESYLGRRVSLWGGEKLSIYQWRNQNVPLSPDNPMRVYLHIGSDVRELSKLNWALLVVIFLILGSYGAHYSSELPALLAYVFGWAVAFGMANFGKVAAFFLSVLLLNLLLRWEVFQKRLAQIKRVFYRFERWIYTK